MLVDIGVLIMVVEDDGFFVEFGVGDVNVFLVGCVGK